MTTVNAPLQAALVSPSLAWKACYLMSVSRTEIRDQLEHIASLTDNAIVAVQYHRQTLAESSLEARKAAKTDLEGRLQ